MASASGHVMLSYQWDKQEMVKKVYSHFKAMGINVWMDIEGGMSGNINDSMAHGVDKASVVCPFMTTKYQDSKNCKKELNYADSLDKVIVPVMAEDNLRAQGWLGVITAGALWIGFRKNDKFEESVASLAKEIIAQAGEGVKRASGQKSGGAKGAAAPPKVILKKQPGRAFQHADSGKYLADTGKVHSHQASGNRSVLGPVSEQKSTSYWLEESAGKKSPIKYFKNCETKGYLGFDGNGDLVYTKSQHFGAEEWILENDETDSSGKRAVVLFANYAKKYLTMRGGKFIGVKTKDKSCKWYLV